MNTVEYQSYFAGMNVRIPLMLLLVSIVCSGCGSKQSANAVNAFVMLSPAGDTIGHGPVLNGMPHGGWAYRLANGTKEGTYDRGLLTGFWKYVLNGTDLSVEWEPRPRTSVADLSMSIPATFQLDSSSGNALHYSWRDSTCYWKLDVHVDPPGQEDELAASLARDTVSGLAGFKSVGHECARLDLSTSKVPIVDRRFHFGAEGGAQLEVRYSNTTLERRSVWLRLEHTCDPDVQNMLYGEILQSLLYKGVYFFDPKGEMRAVAPC